MSSPEAFNQRPLKKFVDIELPELLEDDWCHAFTETYGSNGLRAMLQSPYFIARQEAPACIGKQPSNSWERVWLSDPDDHGVWMDGEVMGAKIVPIKDLEEEYFLYVPHIILKDVTLVNETFSVTKYPEEFIWVPILKDDNRLTCYN